MKIAFFGTPRLAQIVLENLIQSPYKPSLIVTAPDAKSGRGQKVTASPVKQTATENKIEVSTRTVLDLNIDLDLAILVAYGQIIPKRILEIPKFGFINIHPSLLPKYRGPSPIQTAILDGEEITGVTIIKLDEELDHGPFLAQEKVTIKKTDTHLTLIEKLGAIGSNLLLETLPDYISGKVKLQEQNHAKATTTKKITKEDSKIDLLNPPNLPVLDRMIRAYYPWPGVWTRLIVNGSQFTVKLLPQNVIQLEGKRPLTLTQFKNGYPKIYEQIKNLLTQ